jgi:hypothetical protein
MFTSAGADDEDFHPPVSKDFPQPQLWAAWGFLILKPPPVKASEKSTTDPRK